MFRRCCTPAALRQESFPRQRAARPSFFSSLLSSSLFLPSLHGRLCCGFGTSFLLHHFCTPPSRHLVGAALAEPGGSEKEKSSSHPQPVKPPSSLSFCPAPSSPHHARPRRTRVPLSHLPTLTRVCCSALTLLTCAVATQIARQLPLSCAHCSVRSFLPSCSALLPP